MTVFSRKCAALLALTYASIRFRPCRREAGDDAGKAPYCPGFQQYIREVVRLIAAEKPVMIMGEITI